MVKPQVFTLKLVLCQEEHSQVILHKDISMPVSNKIQMERLVPSFTPNFLEVETESDNRKPV